jgi:hypothetical protein
VVQGIQRRQKRYVEVISRTGTDGRVLPLAVVWEDGRTFAVDRVVDMRRAASLKVGGTGVRYICEIMGTRTFLYYEDPLWFVEEKVPPEEPLVIGG